MEDGQCILFVIATIIISICIGHIFTAVFGWLTFGVLLIIMVILDRIWTTREKKRKGVM